MDPDHSQTITLPTTSEHDCDKALGPEPVVIDDAPLAEPEAVTASEPAPSIVVQPAVGPATDLNAAAKPAAPTKSRRAIAKNDFPDGFQYGGVPVPTTIENIEFMLQKMGITVRYNVIKKKLEIDIPGHRGTADDRDNATMTAIISAASLNGFAVSLVPQFVEALGDKHAYNPVADWIKSKAWDGQDRLATFFDTVQTNADYPSKMKETLLRKWLLSAVAAALLPSGFRNRGVLTLQGPQGIGKTSWVLALVSDARIQEQCVKVDHHLDSSDKDSVIGAVSHWVVELGELDSSLKKDVARLKGFLTAISDKVRRPYARVDSEYPRRTVFVATVNENNFLVDTTGNSRWWTIPVISLDFNHGIDMQQLYAQLAVEMEKGEIWWLTDDEETQLALLNAPHQSVSVVEDLVLAHIDDSLKGRASNPQVTASELLRLLGIDKPTNGQAKECATVLRGLLGASSRIKGRDIWRFPGTLGIDNERSCMLLPADAAKLVHRYQ